MELLSNYDNVLETHCRLGLALLLERILSTLEASRTTLGPRVHARLYGDLRHLVHTAVRDAHDELGGTADSGKLPPGQVGAVRLEKEEATQS